MRENVTEDGGTGWGVASMSQGTSKVAPKPQKPGEVYGTASLSEPPEVTNLLTHPDFGFWPSQLLENKSLVV